jgi:hypothetical protein
MEFCGFAANRLSLGAEKLQLAGARAFSQYVRMEIRALVMLFS